MQTINTNEEISCTNSDREDAYIKVIDVGQDKNTNLNYATRSPIKNDGIPGDVCNQDTHYQNVPEQSHDHVCEQNESLGESNRTPDHSANHKKRFCLSVISLCLLLIIGSTVTGIFLFHTSSTPHRSNSSDIFSNKTETPGNLSDCSKTSSNEFFRPVKRYTDSDIENYKTKNDILRNVTYDLTDIQKSIHYSNRSQCVNNPSASEKTKVLQTSYNICGTILFFNGSGIHRSVIYDNVPMINVDCNFDVTQSPETVSFRHISENIEYLRRTSQSWWRKYNSTITLPPFTKNIVHVSVPNVELIFPYAAVMQRYTGRVMQETHREGKVILLMQIENEKIVKNKLDSHYERCLN